MNVSPLDLRQQKFSTAFRGYDPVEVSAFLIAVADDYEQAIRETDRMRQELARLETALRGHLDQEKSLQGALAAGRHPAGNRRSQAETARRRDVARGQHLGLAQHAGLRA